MIQKLIAYFTRHTETFDKELADLAGINGYPAEIAALKRQAERVAKKPDLRVVKAPE